MKRRRQAGSYVGYNGRATSACAQASTLTLVNGQLFVTYANGTVAQYSANSNDPYDYLVPSTTPGSVTTTFSLSSTGTLLWGNAYFYNGAAAFCILPSGDILAIFQQGAQPVGCVFIDLAVVELAACPASSGSNGGTVVVGGAQGVTGATGPSGPSGLAGAVGATGVAGVAGAIGPSGLAGAVGATGVAGAIGPSGPAGAVGATGVAGVAGAIGPSGAPGLAYAYLGCFYQAGTSATPTTNKVLSGGFINTYTTYGDSNCSLQAKTLSNNYYGVTNVAAASVDCYCGDTLSAVTVVGLGTGMASDTNCFTCVGGPSPAGVCGLESSSTIAIYARAF
ncbi:hypothetical protein P7C71_g787, partial [Lecanoromycetidae sp. Uapishka_2]